MPKPPQPHRKLSPRVVAALEYWVEHPALSISELARRTDLSRETISRVVNRHPDAAAVIRRAIGSRLATFGAVRAAGTLQAIIEAGQSEYARLEAAKYALALNQVSPARAAPQGAGGIQINIVAGGQSLRIEADTGAGAGQDLGSAPPRAPENVEIEGKSEQIHSLGKGVGGEGEGGDESR